MSIKPGKFISFARHNHTTWELWNLSFPSSKYLHDSRTQRIQLKNSGSTVVSANAKPLVSQTASQNYLPLNKECKCCFLCCCLRKDNEYSRFSRQSLTNTSLKKHCRPFHLDWAFTARSFMNKTCQENQVLPTAKMPADAWQTWLPVLANPETLRKLHSNHHQATKIKTTQVNRANNPKAQREMFQPHA